MLQALFDLNAKCTYIIHGIEFCASNNGIQRSLPDIPFNPVEELLSITILKNRHIK
jgi:hypothetical protein